MRSGLVTTNESQGGSGEFLRVVEVVEVAESFLMNNLPSAKSDPTIFTINNINYVLPGIGQQSIPCTGILTKTAGAWVEYQVTTPKGVREVEALIYGSSGSSANVDIAVDGVTVLAGQSFVKGTSGFYRLKIPLPTSGTHTIRFTTVTSANITIGGVNVIDLNEFKSGYSFDYNVNINNTNGNQYVATNGSMDYAFLDADTNLWCGSYHGGETRSKLVLLFDDVVGTLIDGQFKVCNIFEVEQETNIMNKINTYSRQRFASDGERELQVTFSGSINLKTLFVNMATTLDAYTEVLYPLNDNLATKDRVTLPEGCNYIIQRNPSNNQRCITVLNNNKLASSEKPFIKKLVGSYCKVYNSNIQSEVGFPFTGGAFRVSHIFS
ncbi:UNVERIFIED_CONTAM: carbohydrate-binding protein [Bacillus sp. ATCC 13368]